MFDLHRLYPIRRRLGISHWHANCIQWMHRNMDGRWEWEVGRWLSCHPREEWREEGMKEEKKEEREGRMKRRKQEEMDSKGHLNELDNRERQQKTQTTKGRSFSHNFRFESDTLESVLHRRFKFDFLLPYGVWYKLIPIDPLIVENTERRFPIPTYSQLPSFKIFMHNSTCIFSCLFLFFTLNPLLLLPFLSVMWPFCPGFFSLLFAPYINPKIDFYIVPANCIYRKVF